jgi:hypothetical protein
MQNFLFSNYVKQPRYNSFDSSGAWYFQWSVRPVISSLWNVRFRNWKYILALITVLDKPCVIFLTRKFVSKHVIQLRIWNKDCPISPDKQCRMKLVNLFFLKHFVIHRCLRSKSSLFDKAKKKICGFPVSRPYLAFGSQFIPGVLWRGVRDHIRSCQRLSI